MALATERSGIREVRAATWPFRELGIEEKVSICEKVIS